MKSKLPTQSNIHKDARIGKFSIIEHDVIVEGDVEIGNYCQIKSGKCN